jgi:hypothetical protein
MEYKQLKQKMTCRGIQLRPGDMLDEGKFQILTNVRSFTEGVIEPRPGLGIIADVDLGRTDSIHSIKRLNDDVSARYARIIGAGTRLYTDNAAHDTFTEQDNGYSGNPLSIVIHRPDQSPLPWAYVMDSSRSRKLKSDGTDYGMGVAPPNQPATATVAAKNYKVINLFDDTTSWTNGGTAGAPSLMAGKRVNTTITYILYDSGSTGWACVSPAALTAQLQPLMFLVAGGSTETILVDDVFPAISSTTISSIKYDSGSTGLCTIQLTAPSAQLRRDSFVRLAAAENVRVLSVTSGPDGVTSFRCSTASTRSAGNAVDGLASFRAYFSNSHSAADTLQDEAFESSVTTGTGNLSLTGSLDLSIVNSRPVKDEDEIVIHARVDDPQSVTEFRMLLDVDGTTHDFQQNALYFTWGPNDFTASAQGTSPSLTVTQQAIQREQVRQVREEAYRNAQIRQSQRTYEFGDVSSFADVDPYISFPEDLPVEQIGLGDSQWSVLRVKVKDLKRIGTDQARGLKDVAAIRVELICTGTVVLNVDSWWIGGTYGVTGNVNYVYRYRSSATKARSNPSPSMRSPLDLNRGQVVLTPTVSSDAQVDKIDWFRFSDTLDIWTLVGSQANSGTFTDTFADEEITDNPTLETDQYQPFPLNDIPRTGTCDVVGTEVTRVSGDTFNTSWASGSEIKINGVPGTLYNSPTSTSRLSLKENMGTLTGATFELPEATILGQPRTVLWGPYGGGESGVFFFSVDGGSLIWTNPDNPDASSVKNRLEVTNPSEPLINGCIYDGRPYVFSSERMFAIYPNFGGTTDFIAQEVANSRGLFATWGLCVGEGNLIYFVGRDGIYESEGGEARAITDDLFPLFPHGGQLGASVNGYLPPDYSQASKMRLNLCDKFLYFDHLDLNGNPRTWVFDTRLRAWYFDDYTPDASIHYGEEGRGVRGLLIGSATGKLYSQVGASDDGADISCKVRTGALNANDPRLYKNFGDVVLDADTASDNISATIGFDNYNSTLSQTVNTAARSQTIIDINLGQQALNVCLDLAWTSIRAIKLYEWITDYLEEVEVTKLRPTDFEDGGYIGAKWLQGCRIHCNTSLLDKVVRVQGDNGITVADLTVNTGNESVQAFSFDPVITHLMRLVPLDVISWRYYSVEWVYEPEPELAIEYCSQPTTHDLNSWQHLRDGFIAHRATTDITLQVIVDGVPYSYTIPHNSGNYQKSYLIFQPIKGKSFQYKLTSSAGFRLYQKDCEMRVKPWNGDYQNIKPFGEISRLAGARI